MEWCIIKWCIICPTAKVNFLFATKTKWVILTGTAVRRGDSIEKKDIKETDLSDIKIKKKIAKYYWMRGKNWLRGWKECIQREGSKCNDKAIKLCHQTQRQTLNEIYNEQI